MNTLKSNKHMKLITDINQIEMGGLYQAYHIRFMAIEIFEAEHLKKYGKILRCLNVEKARDFEIPLHNLEKMIEVKVVFRVD